MPSGPGRMGPTSLWRATGIADHRCHGRCARTPDTRHCRRGAAQRRRYGKTPKAPARHTIREPYSCPGIVATDGPDGRPGIARETPDLRGVAPTRDGLSAARRRCLALSRLVRGARRLHLIAPRSARGRWVGVQGVQNGAQFSRAGRELVGGRGMQDLQTDGPAAVHDPVPQAGGLLPGDVGEPGRRRAAAASPSTVKFHSSDSARSRSACSSSRRRRR